MNIYNETGSGGISACGCVTVTGAQVIFTDFNLGDVAYSIGKARRGIFQKVVIKRIRPVVSRKVPRRNRVIYQDTLNGLWNEDDLVSYEIASSLVENHAQKLLQDARQLSCC